MSLMRTADRFLDYVPWPGHCRRKAKKRENMHRKENKLIAVNINIYIAPSLAYHYALAKEHETVQMISIYNIMQT